MNECIYVVVLSDTNYLYYFKTKFSLKRWVRNEKKRQWSLVYSLPKGPKKVEEYAGVTNEPDTNIMHSNR